MKQIKLSDSHYIVVDEAQEIKVNDWCIMLDSFGNLFSGCQQYLGESAGHYLNKGHIKITHSTQPIESIVTSVENDEPFVEYMFSKIKEYPLFVAKEIAGGVDVNEKAYKYAIDYRCPATNDQEYCKHDIISAYNNGYSQALEDNKDKKYTDEDMLNALYSMWYKAKDGDFNIKEAVKASIDYVQPKTEWEVEIVEGKLKRK